MEACGICGAADNEVAYSEAAGTVICVSCYRRLPSAQYRPPNKPPVRLEPPKPYEPGRYAKFVFHIWDRLDRLTGKAPVYLDGRHIVTYCPACLDGTMLVTFAEIDGAPAARYSSSANPDGCSSGCGHKLIMRVIG